MTIYSVNDFKMTLQCFSMFKWFLALWTGHTLFFTMDSFNVFPKIAAVVKSTLTKWTDVILLVTVHTFNVCVQIELPTKPFGTYWTTIDTFLMLLWKLMETIIFFMLARSASCWYNFLCLETIGNLFHTNAIVR
jgi:hypothetical protein